ncbi:MAG: hypothetical protein QG585_613 [Patescibacteria group bacterium]|nr:hypothetical protein [Patescibacteria group bacterium]
MDTEHPMITKLTKSLEQVTKLLAEGATVVPTTHDKGEFLVLFECDRGYRRIYDPKPACFEWGGGLTIGGRAYTVKDEGAIVNGSIRCFLLQDGSGKTFTVGTNLATKGTRYVYRKPFESWENGY